jgi:hypothetical protein
MSLEHGWNMTRRRRAGNGREQTRGRSYERYDEVQDNKETNWTAMPARQQEL